MNLNPESFLGVPRGFPKWPLCIQAIAVPRFYVLIWSRLRLYSRFLILKIQRKARLLSGTLEEFVHLFFQLDHPELAVDRGAVEPGQLLVSGLKFLDVFSDFFLGLLALGNIAEHHHH